jgi:hypothetical protein
MWKRPRSLDFGGHGLVRLRNIAHLRITSTYAGLARMVRQYSFAKKFDMQEPQPYELSARIETEAALSLLEIGTNQ